MKLPSFIAGVFGTVGFAVSTLAGAVTGNSMESVLGRALLCVMGCYVVGYFVGLIAQQVAEEHARHVTEAVRVADEKEAAEEREADAARDAEAAANNAALDTGSGAGGTV